MVSSLSPPLINLAAFYLLRPVYVSQVPPSLALVGSCSLPFIPHLNIACGFLVLPGHIHISTWITGAVVVMIPKKEQRIYCVLLLISRINYCMSLCRLWEKGRKIRLLLRRTLRLSVTKIQAEFVLGQRVPVGWIRKIMSLYIMIPDAWLSPFLWIFFLIPVSWMYQLCL